MTHARGDWLVFLDSDCRLEGSYLDRIAAHADRGAEVVGGPVLLREPATPLEVMFQGLLGHPLLTGASSSRYRSKGALRKCDDAELILCNLAVRRDLFLKSTGFDERLYPNEENEWLARLRAQGVDLWHDPDLVVRRPQRKSWPAYVRMLTGYGRGRTRQFRVSGRWDFARQLPAVGIPGLAGALCPEAAGCDKGISPDMVRRRRHVQGLFWRLWSSTFFDGDCAGCSLGASPLRGRTSDGILQPPSSQFHRQGSGVSLATPAQRALFSFATGESL